MRGRRGGGLGVWGRGWGGARSAGAPLTDGRPCCSAACEGTEPLHHSSPCHPCANTLNAPSSSYPNSLMDEFGEPLGPHRVWLPHAWVPGLAMSRALGDQLAHQVRRVGAFGPRRLVRRCVVGGFQPSARGRCVGVRALASGCLAGP